MEAESSTTVEALEHERPPKIVVDRTIAERYEIIEKLGTGGMSTVYRVRHLHLDKSLALKLLHQVSPVSVQRFQLEAKAASLLEHPNIIRVHDFGVTDGQPYMTMDCIEGESLSQILAKGSLPVDRLIRLFGQICNALAHAHDQGVVHRDLKPSNIIVRSTENAGEQAIVVDFGIAKLLDDSGDPQNDLTRTGDIFGTPMYMSPEQGQGLRVDTRSDIYSLACMMYEAATGKAPFNGDSIYHTIHMQISEAPPPFPEKIRRTSAGRRLEALILKSMAKDPGDRHKHMIELANDLRSVESDGGAFSDLKSFVSTFSLRVKATERKNVVVKAILQSSTAAVIVAASLISSLPSFVLATPAQISSNEEILSISHKIFDWEKRKNAVFYTSNLTPSIDRISSLRPTLHGFQRKKFDIFMQRLNAAMNRSKKMNQVLRENMVDDMSISVLGLANMKSFLGDVISLWSNASLACEELKSCTREKIQSESCALAVMSWALVLSVLLGPFFAIVLGVYLIRAYNHHRRVEREIDSSRDPLGLKQSLEKLHSKSELQQDLEVEPRSEPS